MHPAKSRGQEHSPTTSPTGQPEVTQGFPPRCRGEEQLVERVAGLRQSRNKIDAEKNPEAYDTITKEIEEAERELNTFVDRLWKNYEPYAAVKYPRPVKLKDAAIRPDENLLIFDVVGEGVGVKLIRGKEILTTFYVKWDMKDLERSVKKFLEPFENFDLKGFDPDLAQVLFKRLVGRALYQVPEGTPITIIPDGVLATLPFEALVMGGKAHWVQGPKGYRPEGLKFLGDAYPISYYQSITALHLARTLGQTIKPSSKMLVLADPVFEADDSRLKAEARAKERETIRSLPLKLMSATKEIGLVFKRLPLTEELADTLKKTYANQTTALTGLKAEKEALFRNPLNDYGYIVFATHGYFGTDLPGIQEPILALTLVDQPKNQDGFLRMTEVMALKLNADVVALTACQSGIGSQVRGEGVMGMGRAFQYAGARSVLMSLWSVSERSSVTLMERFFAHVKEGKPKLEALNLARREIRAQGWDHPFFWAPFILVGEAR